MNSSPAKDAVMTVQIVFRGPVIAEHADDAGTEQERFFNNLTSLTDWVAVHIPETERGLVKLWINGIPITGATLQATRARFPSRTWQAIVNRAEFLSRTSS